MADKGKVHYCTWNREADGSYSGWEVRNPAFRATAPTLPEMHDRLCELIYHHYDDQEAALDFDPPLSESSDDALLFADELAEITWNALFHFRPTAAKAYSAGRCPRCGSGLGRRTELPLTVDEISDATDGACSPRSNEALPCFGMPGNLMIVSERFLAALSDEERQTFEARAVSWASRSRRKFYELIPQTIIPFGLVKGIDTDGWRCEQCGRIAFSQSHLLGNGVHVICRQSLPMQPERFFFAGSPTEVHLYCTRKRWRTFAGTPHARKITSFPLAVVNSSAFDEGPPLVPTLDEITVFRREHGYKVRYRPDHRK